MTDQAYAEFLRRKAITAPAAEFDLAPPAPVVDIFSRRRAS